MYYYITDKTNDYKRYIFDNFEEADEFRKILVSQNHEIVVSYKERINQIKAKVIYRND